MIKVLVSKKKRRFQENGFDLDLTYITNNIIAMGYPAERLEGLYRNNIDDVVKMLGTYHNDNYAIYNLCSERDYNSQKFSNRVVRIPFDDHGPPRFPQIREFCVSVASWLAKRPNNVVAVHCKAGKGRTGVMICAYLMYAGVSSGPDSALRLYAEKRTLNNKGVTIPSQCRYVYYYAHLHNRELNYRDLGLELIRVDLEGIQNANNTGVCSPFFSVFCNDVEKFTSRAFEVRREWSRTEFWLPHPLDLAGDVKMIFYNKTRMKKEKLFHFWWNTFFAIHGPADALCHRESIFLPPASLRSSGSVAMGDRPRSSTDETVGYLRSSQTHPQHRLPQHTVRLTFTKSELDVANKDRSHRLFPSDLKVTLYLGCSGCRDCLLCPCIPDVITRPASRDPVSVTSSTSFVGGGNTVGDTKNNLVRCTSSIITNDHRNPGSDQQTGVCRNHSEDRYATRQAGFPLLKSGGGGAEEVCCLSDSESEDGDCCVVSSSPSVFQETTNAAQLCT